MNAARLITLASVVLFVLVHVFGARLSWMRTPRSIWLSAAGGVSVAYVFVHLLPELAAHQQTFEQRTAGSDSWLAALDSHVYLIALLGLGLFYGVEQLARSAGGDLRCEGESERSPLPVFWFHLGVYAAYNVLIGYLLVVREAQSLRELATYAIAMGVHFVVNDHALREQHRDAYHRRGRWLLAVAPVIGVLIGIGTDVEPLLLTSLFAVLAGGVMLNVLKEELPAERQSRFSAFAAGAGLYTALLVVT